MATSSDAVVAELEQRIVALEVGQSFDATRDAVRRVEYELLVKLRDIRAALESGSNATNSSEMQALKLENEQLKRRNAKLEYRVQHVVGHMEQLYSYRESE